MLKLYLSPILVSVLIFGATMTAQTQSFDCSKAQSDTEWAICNTPELEKMDQEAVAIYQTHMNPKNPEIYRAKTQKMQISWLHNSRDQCEGNVDCLIKSYNKIKHALGQLSPSNPSQIHATFPKPVFTPPDSEDTGDFSIVPDCSKHFQDINDEDARYTTSACKNLDLLSMMKQVDQLAQELRPKLPRKWQDVLIDQQRNFPNTGEACATEKEVQCLTAVVEQRIQELEDLTAHIKSPLPACKTSEIQIHKSDVATAGMSHIWNAYYIEYKGNTACQIRGYPAAAVIDEHGRSHPSYISYTGGTYFANIATPPLPVTLSPKNKTAWFAIETADACDPVKGTLSLRIGLPHSTSWIHTQSLTRSDGLCPRFSIMPITALSVLKSFAF